MDSRTYRRLGMALLLLACMLVFVPEAAWAQSAAPNTNESCTDLGKLAANMSGNEPGILTNIVLFIKDVVYQATQKLFESFTSNDAYQYAVAAAATLMVTFYGVAFTIGVVQASFGEVLKRLIKLGIIFTVISPTGFTFFSDYVIRFFDDGTDYIIANVLRIGMQSNFTPGDSPFLPIDGIASYMLSPDMIIGIIGTTTNSGPYGLMMGGLMGFALTGFIKLLIEGLKTYAIAFILRAILFGVAPIFIVFLLFEKTKPLFQGWINTILGQALLPILYFTFLSFFLVMMTGAARDMMGGAEFCFTEVRGAEGTSNKVSQWTLKMPTSTYAEADTFTWQGATSCLINGGTDCEEFPINIIDVLTFLILVYVATQFAEVIDNIAAEISNSAVNLSKEAKFSMAQMGGGKGGSPLNQNAGGG